MAFNFNNSAVSGVTYSGIDYEAYITSNGDLNDYYEDSSKTWDYGAGIVPAQSESKHDFGESHYFNFGQYNGGLTPSGVYEQVRIIPYFNAEPVNKVIYNGSTVFELDSDGDGVADSEDAFPNDASETTDSDGDGVGDNADAFPNDPTQTTAPTRSINAQVTFDSATKKFTFSVNPNPARGLIELISLVTPFNDVYNGPVTNKTWAELYNAGLSQGFYPEPNYFGNGVGSILTTQSNELDSSFNGLYNFRFGAFSKDPFTETYDASQSFVQITDGLEPPTLLEETVTITINI